MLEIIIALLVVLGVGYLIYKKYNATIALAVGGIILLFAAVILGHPVLSPEETTGIVWLDPFKKVEISFLKNLGNIGLTIMTLFGFSGYMNLIGANEVTVDIMTKPLGKIKSKYFIVPVIFLLGNLLSLVVPSASSLAVLLMATLYPVLTKVGVTPLTAGAVIATTATIMPTPLGADNVLAAETFGMNIMDYVIAHAKVSIPTLVIMAVAHYFWQKYLDKKQSLSTEVKIDESKLAKLNNNLPPKYYAILPILPLILVLFFNIFMKEVQIGLVSIAFISLIVAVILELIRKKDFVKVSNDINEFFKGMGNGLAMVVSLLVAASLLVDGLKALGVVDMITNSVQNLHGAGTILMLAFSGVTFLIGLISGGGLSVFYASVEMIPELAAAVGVAGPMIALPMQMVANLVRSISPVAACIIVVCSITGTNPMQIVKRTSVPILVGVVSTLILSVILL
ncbi:C4-dicarboxylate ABC transporter [Clostridium paraputrificum]|uniref:C4-dicarboxylate transporter DcuC n=1 Tax=Clostridium paraputrificum TaxID=29363 RepID=UPI000EA1EE4A|nr:C4-dicarboxylate transporter DcuC [Clostridium paraputrificum]RKI47659.1 C4-dicarboxylate ABC transporter [Clostridium paraputrificum]